MLYKVELFPSAIKELRESSQWYEEQSEGLGNRFVNVIYKSFHVIERSPDSFTKKKGRYRQFVVDKFPFVIIYEVTNVDGIVNILHVFHASRNPKFKYKRK